MDRERFIKFTLRPGADKSILREKLFISYYELIELSLKVIKVMPTSFIKIFHKEGKTRIELKDGNCNYCPQPQQSYILDATFSSSEYQFSPNLRTRAVLTNR